MLIREFNLKVEIFWNLNKTSHMSELNPCCGALYVKSSRPSYSGQRRTDFQYEMVGGNSHKTPPVCFLVNLGHLVKKWLSKYDPS